MHNFNSICCSSLLTLVYGVHNLHSETTFTVRDFSTREPIISANVQATLLRSVPSQNKLADTTIRLRTNRQGKFTLKSEFPVSIVVTYIGYKKKTDTLHPLRGLLQSGDIFLQQASSHMDEVVVTGQFTPSSAERSVHKVKVLDRERIEQQQAVTLRDLLSNELNIRLSQDNILGSSMSIQGVSGQNVKILIDGVPMVGRLGGNIDLSQINLNNVERVEIVEGPMSVMYGTDALGGVVNIITKSRTTEQSVEGNAQSYYESVGIYNVDGRLSYRKKETEDTYAATISGGRNFFAGFSENPAGRSRQWKPREQYYLDWQLAWSIENVNFRYDGKVFSETILNRGDLRAPYFETAFDDVFKTSRMTNALFIDGKIGTEHYYNITTSYSTYNRKKNSYYKDLVQLSEQQLTTEGSNDTNTFASFMSRGFVSSENKFRTINYQIGYDATFDKAGGLRMLNGEQTAEDVAVWGNVNYSPSERITHQLGIRYGYNSRYSAPIIPSLNIRYGLLDNVLLRASYARGFRAPSLQELFFYFVDINHNIQGNPNLKAETSHNVNVSLQYSVQTENSILKCTPSFFYNDISQQITLTQADNTGTLFTYLNLERFRSLGSNFVINYMRPNISAQVGFSYIGRRNQLPTDGISEGLSSSERFLYAQEIQSSLMYTFPEFGATISLFYKYTGKLPNITVLDGKLVEGVISDYQTLDCTISKDMFDKYVTVGIGGKNLFNVRTIASSTSVSGGAHTSGASSLPVSWGRTFFATLRVKFKSE